MPGTDALRSKMTSADSPFISILVAVRNEETTIPDCLNAFVHLNYPPECFEVLIGNDQSTDRTGIIVSEYIADKPNYRLVDITTSVAGLRGKANVLAQLAKQAKGTLFFFTDADTQVPAGWLLAMSRRFTARVGIVTGVTLPEGAGLFDKLQGVDWLYNLTLTHLLGILDVPVTAMGNNMAVTKDAYEAVGGYDSLPFSVVEDYTLFQAIVAKGNGFVNLMSESVLAKTEPVKSLSAFLQQRKRWMIGASSLPTWMVAGLYCQYLAGPLLLLVSLVSLPLAIGVYIIKLLIQTMVLSFGLSRLNQTKLWPYALFFEVYQLIIGPLSVAFYLLPIKIEWKGRRYE
jgi:cellulose synthase/poly-beta-1,6-N-acetylglucosamine synthase-like glycosyltransferase